MRLSHKNVHVSGFKVIDDAAGTFEAFVSVTGNVDSDGERILPGAFVKSLKRRTPKGVWSHIWSQTVGKTLASEEISPGDDRLPARIKSKGWGALYIKGAFNLRTQRGFEAWEDVKFYGEEQEWSIGFMTKRSKPVDEADRLDPTHWRDLVEIDLFEWSPVLFGANSETVTVGVKSAEETVSLLIQELQAGLVEMAEGVGIPNPKAELLHMQAEILADRLMTRVLAKTDDPPADPPADDDDPPTDPPADPPTVPDPPADPPADPAAVPDAATVNEPLVPAVVSPPGTDAPDPDAETPPATPDATPPAVPDKPDEPELVPIDPTVLQEILLEPV